MATMKSKRIKEYIEKKWGKRDRQEDTQTQQSSSLFLNPVMSWCQVLILNSGRWSKVVFISWWLTMTVQTLIAQSGQAYLFVVTVSGFRISASFLFTSFRPCKFKWADKRKQGDATFCFAFTGNFLYHLLPDQWMLLSPSIWRQTTLKECFQM